MKKSLFAVAAMSAVAGVAQAQSSVTVYGIMDLGYYGTNTSYTNSSGTQYKSQSNRFTNGNEDTSRLGFKGTEDLGGGTSAFFTVEMGLTPADSNLSGTTATLGSTQAKLESTSDKGGTSVNNRQSFVGLKKNGVGSIMMGRQYTLAYAAQSGTSPTNNATQVGSVLYPQGTPSSSYNTGVEGDAGLTLRASNALIAKSDKFAGFSVSGMYVLNNANSTQNNSVGTGNVNWNGWGLAGDYTWNKLYLTYAYQSFKTQYTTGVSSAALVVDSGYQVTALTALPAATSAGSSPMFQAQNTSDKQQYAGATYDFGILKAYAGWMGRQVNASAASGPLTLGKDASGNVISYTSNSTAASTINRTAQQIGVRSYITPVIEAWGAIGNGKIKDTTNASANFNAWQIGSNYYMSKRTNVYAIYGQQLTSNVSGTGQGATASGYSLGLRHTF